MIKISNEHIVRFGFKLSRGGAHSARTMMLDELSTLLSYINDVQAIKEDYFKAVIDDNCLGKRSGKTRSLTARHLADLYSLDPNVTIFKVLLYLWNRDEKAHPLLALLCTIVRDNIFNCSIPFILGFTEGEIVHREALEEHIENIEPGRFSKATLKSTAQNINSTWTKSGHLKGRRKKIRSTVHPTAGVIAYALFLGYLEGHRGEVLFKTKYIKLLDCSFEKAIELAGEASQKGWIVLKKAGNVIEVLFPNFLNSKEMEWISEQN